MLSPFGVERDDRLVEAVEASRVLEHDDGLEVAFAVTPHVDRHRTDVGADRLSRDAVSPVARTATL